MTLAYDNVPDHLFHRCFHIFKYFELFQIPVIEPEEVLLDRVFCWPDGMLCPSLEPLAAADDDDEEQDQESSKKEEKKSDVEIMGKDVVLALMQMNFLPRLRYDFVRKTKDPIT